MISEADRSLCTRAALWRDTRVRGTTKLVALAIAQMADEDGWARAKQADIAALATCGVRAVRESVNALERMGLVEVERGGCGPGAFGSYRLTIGGR